MKSLEDYKYADEFGSNYRKRTVKSIKEEISYRTDMLNYYLDNAEQEEIISWDEATYLRMRIKSINTLNKAKKSPEKYFMKGSKIKSKEKLIRYARELSIFAKESPWTDEGQELLSQQYKQGKETLISNIPNMKNITDEQYNSLVLTASSLDEELFETYDSTQFFKDMAEFDDLSGIHVADILEEVYETVGKTDQQKFQRLVLEKIKEELAKEGN